MDRPPQGPGTLELPTDAAILDSLGVALMAVDQHCQIIRFNGPAEELTGFRGPEVVGKACEDVLRASLCHSTCPVREAMRSGTTCCYGTVVLQTAKRAPRTVEVTASALVDESGRIRGAVGILRDVTEDPGQVRIYGSRVFVSRTPAMRRVFDALPKLAGSRAPLLIVGGRGSGRSALAETIHTLSVGAAPPEALSTVKCTSARGMEALDRILERPGGTLLLEDICAAPIKLQQQLLAWIESSEDLPFRVMSTATERLESCLERGLFRRDLFYRLNVLHVALPSLRERVEDIPLLVAQFIEDLNIKRRKEVVGLTPAAMARLQEAELPGNVRQLRMIVDYAHGRCHSQLIEVGHLPDLASWRSHKANLEREAIQSALEQTGGNITKAAQVLQMHRTTLWRKIKRHKLDV
jgi:PAS domain S-box-containing protein